MSNPCTVAISQRIDLWTDRGERRDALDQRVVGFVEAAGAIAFPVPNAAGTSPFDPEHLAHARLERWLAVVEPAGIVLSGGNDIGDAPDRDATESCLLAYAQARRLPVLGICRGMQMMTVWGGGTLHGVTGHVARRHRLTIIGEGGEWPLEVNSFHGVGVATCPDTYSVEAVATDDGAIEAMRHKSLPWEGWMWHPERENPFTRLDVARFRALLHG